MHRFLFGVGALALIACSSSDPTLEIDVTTGHETGALDASPAVTQVKITATPLSGSSGALSATAKPGGSFDLGDVDSATPYTIAIEGTTASGAVVVEGRSLPIAPSSIDGDAFSVFCQRVNTWARPPSALLATHVGGTATIAAERFLFLSGGSKVVSADGTAASGTQGDFYDLVSLGGATASDALPFAPKTAVGLGDTALLIDDDGATWLSFEDGTTTDASAPSGLESFRDVAGGRSFIAPDGRTIVLGATRGETATASLLSIGSDDTTLGAFELASPRVGAAAGWVDGVGLVVAGGASEAPGVEVLPDGDSGFKTRPYPNDATIGAGIGATAGGVYLIGGVNRQGAAPTRRIDPGCTSACKPSVLADLTLPVGLVETQVFVLESERLLAAGVESKGGHARAFVLDIEKKTVTELKLHEARIGATFTAAPNGTLAALGGLHDDGTPAVDIELLFPR
jgi:hypothetical protein